VVFHAMFRTDNHEIHIDEKEPNNWYITIFTIHNAVRELAGHRIVHSFDEAFAYVEGEFLKKSKRRGIPK